MDKHEWSKQAINQSNEQAVKHNKKKKIDRSTNQSIKHPSTAEQKTINQAINQTLKLSSMAKNEVILAFPTLLNYKSNESSTGKIHLNLNLR